MGRRGSAFCFFLWVVNTNRNHYTEMMFLYQINEECPHTHTHKKKNLISLHRWYSETLFDEKGKVERDISSYPTYSRLRGGMTYTALPLVLSWAPNYWANSTPSLYLEAKL